MHYIAGHIYTSGRLQWEYIGDRSFGNNPEGVQISFSSSIRTEKYIYEREIADALTSNSVDWLYKDKLSWRLNSEGLKKKFASLRGLIWLSGTLTPLVNIEHIRRKLFNRENDETYCQFIVTPDIAKEQMSRHVFLSHKGVDKPRVRRFKNALETVGAVPWLDEASMHAGVELERSLLQGFVDSCAAVFFITPKFQDENFLATEINYAISQKRNKGSKFSIIPLVFTGPGGTVGTVPALLRPYVHINVKNDLDAFTEIVRALPIRLGDLGWR